MIKLTKTVTATIRRAHVTLATRDAMVGVSPIIASVAMAKDTLAQQVMCALTTIAALLNASVTELHAVKRAITAAMMEEATAAPMERHAVMIRGNAARQGITAAPKAASAR